MKITRVDPKACSCLRRNEDIWMLYKARCLRFKTGCILDPELEIFRIFSLRKRSARGVFDKAINILSIGYFQN